MKPQSQIHVYLRGFKSTAIRQLGSPHPRQPRPDALSSFHVPGKVVCRSTRLHPIIKQNKDGRLHLKRWLRREASNMQVSDLLLGWQTHLVVNYSPVLLASGPNWGSWALPGGRGAGPTLAHSRPNCHFGAPNYCCGPACL